MRRALAVLFVLFSGMPGFAGDWQPNPGSKHQLTAPPESPAPATAAEDRWVQSLLEGLGVSDAKPKTVYRFVRSSAVHRVNGEVSNRLIFVKRDDPEIFVVVYDGVARTYAEFEVDFGKQRVSAHVDGATVHVPMSRRYCVVVLDEKGLAGIPIEDGDGNPSFSGRTASWY